MARWEAAACAAAAAGAAVWMWLLGGGSSAPDYAEPATWFAREAGGDKAADLFFAHPTTHPGLLRWNLGW